MMKLFSRKSFTLTEAVVSIFILIIIWLSAVNTLIVGKYSASYAKHKTQAAYAAQQEIERLRKLPFANILSSNINGVSIDTRGTPNNTADDFKGRRIVTVSGDLGYYKSVIVEMQWSEILFGTNRTMREYVGTYIANEPQIN
ncbi:MAG: hypothetical protein Q8R38_07415 [Candidatus Omnitrophota bacterium]|nr:hypothetical protein [Candidatus Omnitrophota bacterium]